MIIQFTVIGDPVGKLKMTRGQQWTPQAQNYVGYKNAIMTAAKPSLDALGVDLRETDPKKLLNPRNQKPIGERKGKIRLDVMVHFHNEVHPDPGNVWETVADAIFAQDKHVYGLVDFDHEGLKGASVDVIITL